MPVSLLVWYNIIWEGYDGKNRTKRKTADLLKQYYEKNKERLLEEKKKWWANWYAKNKPQLLLNIRQKKWALKEEVLTHYGNGKCACTQCGFNDIRALSIDHIKGNGDEHRTQIKCKQGGVTFYRWLRKNGYPPEYQTLCMNCQFIKRIEKQEHYK